MHDGKFSCSLKKVRQEKRNRENAGYSALNQLMGKTDLPPDQSQPIHWRLACATVQIQLSPKAVCTGATLLFITI